MDANELRGKWIDFFASRAHTPVSSAGLIPHHPSAPMFTNSGMMQFVPYFLGEEEVPFKPRRAVTVQKCVRAGGKHNDLDAIGRSMRHLSFFEMLGNFSFGDYFKPEAITWAWEFITSTLGLDGDRIWITVHTSDDEAEKIWVDQVGIPIERVQRLDKDNFWEMGETGPCGPSSELFWDFGPELGPEGGPANPAAENRYVEIWNLVFPQYFRGVDGSLSDLDSPGIDTGAGLERILGVLAGSPSLYAADTLSVLVDKAQSVTGQRLGEDRLGDVALRLIADHTRTVSFLVSDGVVPSNEERGYVLRRVLRRAVYFSFLLGVDKPVLPPMIEAAVALMGSAYPDLKANADSVMEIVSREEDRFRRTLRTGLGILDQHLETMEQGEELSGQVAFGLHDTYGFPFEVTQEIISERGYRIDEDGFATAMAGQRSRAKAAAKSGVVAVGEAADRFKEIISTHGPTTFVGRETNSQLTTLVAVVELPSVADPNGTAPNGVMGNISVILSETPFYAESGGQVGDVGTLEILDDAGQTVGTLEVLDTTYVLPGLHSHRVDGAGLGDLAPSLIAGVSICATIDSDRRNDIRRHHTATHLLHWALREVLGDHVKQQGSLVEPNRLRFDFSHFESVTPAQIQAVEDLVNRDILNNPPADHFETSMTQAQSLGAIAFFGDKYGDTVRVLRAGPHSIELCGGTHVRRLGDIGPVKVIAEMSIGSNLRRIEAVAGTGPIHRLRSREAELAEVATQLGVPPGEVVAGASRLRDQVKALESDLKSLRRQMAAGSARELLGSAQNGMVVARVDGVERSDLRDMALSLSQEPGLGVVVLGGSPEGGGAALVAVTAEDSGFHSGQLISAVKTMIKGGGNNDPRLVVAGGKDPDGVDPALDSIRTALGLG